MRTEFVYHNSRIYIMYNDEYARTFAQDTLLKSAVKLHRNVIFLAYHLQDEYVLLHVKPLEINTSFYEAIRQVKTELLFDKKLVTQDEILRKKLNEPKFSTRDTFLESYGVKHKIRNRTGYCLCGFLSIQEILYQFDIWIYKFITLSILDF